jgi:hypothetical protein
VHGAEIFEFNIQAVIVENNTHSMLQQYFILPTDLHVGFLAISPSKTVIFSLISSLTNLYNFAPRFTCASKSQYLANFVADSGRRKPRVYFRILDQLWSHFATLLHSPPPDSLF